MKPEKEWNTTSYYLSYLYLRCSQFKETLEVYNKELESFKKRGDIVTTEELRKNTQKLEKLNKNIADALAEFEVSI